MNLLTALKRTVPPSKTRKSGIGGDVITYSLLSAKRLAQWPKWSLSTESRNIGTHPYRRVPAFENGLSVCRKKVWYIGLATLLPRVGSSYSLRFSLPVAASPLSRMLSDWRSVLILLEKLRQLSGLENPFFQTELLTWRGDFENFPFFRAKILWRVVRSENLLALRSRLYLGCVPWLVPTLFLRPFEIALSILRSPIHRRVGQLGMPSPPETKMAGSRCERFLSSHGQGWERSSSQGVLDLCIPYGVPFLLTLSVLLLHSCCLWGPPFEDYRDTVRLIEYHWLAIRSRAASLYMPIRFALTDQVRAFTTALICLSARFPVALCRDEVGKSWTFAFTVRARLVERISENRNEAENENSENRNQ
ncbi:hypothetical protein Tco_0773447 [Tanacetum coccineum]|uniref:Maturase K n=1 Tax=Tanacetum coccineum TaxID=301880 RepID=A0ABQ4ZND8_9ASTR